MANKSDDFSEKIKNKLKDIERKTPSRSKDPKYIQKKVLELTKEKKDTKKKKKANLLEKTLKKLNL